MLNAVVLPKRRGRVKRTTRERETMRSLMMNVLSTQYESRENVAQSLVPTGGGNRQMLSLPSIIGLQRVFYQKPIQLVKYRR